MNLSKKKITAFVAGALALTLAVGSWAYYTSNNTVDNQLKTKAYGDTLKEEFTPDEDWQPGEEVDKKVAVKNTGDYNLLVRIKLSEKWVRGATSFKTLTTSNAASMAAIITARQDNPTDGLVDKDDTVVNKTLDLTNWVPGTDGYWYYKEQLAPGADTGNFMTKIQLAVDADMGEYTTNSFYFEGLVEPTKEPDASSLTNTDATKGWAKFTGSVPKPATSTNKIFTRVVSGVSDKGGYSGADYTLTIISETLQATSDALTANPNWQKPAGNNWGL
ncbi:MAG: BsaA family SipW-dependent biofilm matrix protein [Gemmiger sp.]|nr:BsaA family SipW-dependent biofilm matrix protein [Gemmiger sp.]